MIILYKAIFSGKRFHVLICSEGKYLLVLYAIIYYKTYLLIFVNLLCDILKPDGYVINRMYKYLIPVHVY